MPQKISLLCDRVGWQMILCCCMEVIDILSCLFVHSTWNDPSTWCFKAFSRVDNLHGGSMNSSHQIRWTNTLKTSQEDLPRAGRPPAKPRLCPLLGIVASLLVHIQDLPSRVETSWRPGPLWSYSPMALFFDQSIHWWGKGWRMMFYPNLLKLKPVTFWGWRILTNSGYLETIRNPNLWIPWFPTGHAGGASSW